MEKGQILTILITFVSSLLTSLAGSSVLTGYLNRRWAQSNKDSSILEEQYLKVISPIYRELQLNSSDKEKMISDIGEIISDNFSLLPEQLLEKYNNISADEDEFKKLISDFYILLRNKLGYSRIKVSKEIKEKEKLLASKKIISIVDSIFINFLELFGIVITTFSAFGIYLLSTTNQGDKNQLIVLSVFLIIGIISVILPIIYFIKTNHQSKS